MRAQTVYVLVCAAVVLTRADGQNLRVKRSAPRWTQVNDRQFLFVPQPLSWGQAELNCLSMDGNLASVHSADEYHSIQTMIAKATGGFQHAWIGGSDCQHEGIWFWSDGTPFKYRHCGRFDNVLWRQHCLQMNFGSNKCWDDQRCVTKLASVCAKKSVCNPWA